MDNTHMKRSDVLKIIGEWINAILRPAGFELHRRSAWDRVRRATYEGGLEHLNRRGFVPRTVIDVGVARGTPALYETFPEARFLLIDPLEESRPYMERIVRGLPRASYVLAAAGRQPGNMLFNAHPEIERSSAYWESDYLRTDVATRTVPAVTLDQMKSEKKLEGPFLLKIDVQGAEIDVLEGSTEILRDTECILLETSLFEFFDGAPLAVEVVEYMNRIGYSIYDVWALQYRPHDDALIMIDFAFVKTSGRFRALHRFHPESRPR
jgi:FkbM family methyltransferase